MLLVVDDEREFEREDTIHVQTTEDAKEHLLNPDVWEVSLDHDLGWREDVRPLVLWMIENRDKLGHIAHVYVHSMNPVGAQWAVDSLKPYFPDVRRITLNALGKLL